LPGSFYLELTVLKSLLTDSPSVFLFIFQTSDYYEI